MKSSRYLFIGVSICLILLLSIGVSYSMWRQTLVGTSSIIATTDCFDVSITSEENAISLGDEAIVDADYKGIALTPYTFTIKNTCNVNATYSVNLVLFSTTGNDGKDKTLDEQYVKTFLQGNNKEVLSMVNKLDSLSNDVMVNDMKITASNLKSGYVLTSDVIGANESVTYNLNLWIDNSSEEELSSNLINDKVFNAKIYIKSEPTTSSSTISSSTTNTLLLNSAILRNNKSKGTPDLTTSPTDDTSGVYEAEDDYGTSYVYRGLKSNTNNHIIFAGFCWQIIRINGDGSIRIMYNGTPSSGTCSTDNNILSSSSAFNSSYNDNAYVGYMYGSTGASTYDATHTNTTSSTIKGNLDTWYESNLKDTIYESYLADNGFCNDRSIDTATYKGYGTDKTYYKPYTRLVTTAPTPTLKCNQNNDFFTTGSVETQTDGITGNGKLTYPIGLITADEAVYAGLLRSNSSTNNKNVWLVNATYYYWTMSPFSFSGSYAIVWDVGASGYLSFGYVDGSRGVRPVVSLISDISVSGTGKSSDPYLVNVMDYEVTIDESGLTNASVNYKELSSDSIQISIESKDNYYFETAPTVSIANGTAVIGEITEDSSGYTVTITNITSDITLSISGTAKMMWTEIDGTSITTETIGVYTITLDVSNFEIEWGIENVEKYILFGVYDNGDGSFVIYIDDTTNNILNGLDIMLEDDEGNLLTPSATTDTGSGYQYIWSITGISDMNLTIVL